MHKIGKANVRIHGKPDKQAIHNAVIKFIKTKESKNGKGRVR